MDKFNDVEYRQLPNDEECMITAVKIGEIISEPYSVIRTWAEYHEENLYIKKVNGRFKYTQKSVEQFKFIKELVREKNMSHEQVRQHMSKHGEKYSQFDGGLMDPKDPLGYTALSSSLALENKKQLEIFMNDFVKYQEQNNKKIIEEMKKEIMLTTQDVIEENLRDFKEELAITKETNEKIEELRLSMEYRKEESEKEHKKGILDRIFKRKE